MVKEPVVVPAALLIQAGILITKHIEDNGALEVALALQRRLDIARENSEWGKEERIRGNAWVYAGEPSCI
jgi:hypothetical protein